MAIQHRRGQYSDFDPSKMVNGEAAIVLSGDPNTSDGKAAYIAFSPGNVKRIATVNDMQTELQNVIEGVVDEATQRAETAAQSIESSATQITELGISLESITEQTNYRKGFREDGYFHIQPIWIPKYYVSSSGVESQSDVWVGSRLIGVESGDVITYSGGRIDGVSFFVMILTYDANKNFIARIQNTETVNNPYIIPDNVKYIRFDLGYASSQNMTRYPDIRLFDAYLDNSYINTVIEEEISARKTVDNNLLVHVHGNDENIAWELGTLDSRGRNYQNDNYIRTGFISAGERVIVNNPNNYRLYICTFDEEKENIITLTNFIGEWDTSDAQYFRICAKTDSGQISDAENIEIHVEGVTGYIKECEKLIVGEDLTLNWENGTLTTTGGDYPSDTYIRTGYIAVNGATIIIENPNNYNIYICTFDETKTLISTRTRMYTNTYDVTDISYIRICANTGNVEDGLTIALSLLGILTRLSTVETNITTTANLCNDIYIENRITMLFSVFKRFGVIGDSMAAGHLYPNPSTSANNYDDKQYAWGTFLTQYLGTTYYNFSQHGHDPKTFIEGKFPVWNSAGTTITGYTNVEDGNNFSTVVDGNHDVPLMFIAVGINNKFKLEMGSVSDIDVSNPDNNADTRYGWYAKLVQKVSAYYFNKNQPLIMVMLTFPFFSSTSVTERYAPLVRDVYSTLKNPIEQNTNNRLILIDLQADNSLYVSDFMMAQTIQNHYAGIGYNVAGMDLLRRLNRLIYDNPDIFKRVDQITSNTLITAYTNPSNFT